MTAVDALERFTLLGGPLHELGRRFGLVRGDHTVRLGLALGVGTWLLMAVLAFLQGVAERLFSLSVVGGHVRLLVVIPLFFICESWVAPLMRAFVSTIAARVVVAPSRAALAAEAARVVRWTSAPWPDLACLVAAIAIEIAGASLQPYGATAAYDTSRTAIAAFFYFHVGVTLFRFLLFRWAWRLAVWVWLLWRMSRLELRLLPAHPDRAGGLGLLEVVHERFAPLVAALSALQCASLTESITTGGMEVPGVHPWLLIGLLLDALLFLAPMLVFTDKLWAARTNGLAVYMQLATRYVSEFEAKWGSGAPATEPLLGSADIQSLADLGNAVSVVKGMRWITVSPRLLTSFALAAIVPLTPLLLFRYPFGELAQKFFSHLLGL